MKNIKVKDIMTDKPVFIGPHETLEKAADIMMKHDIGFLPVGNNSKITGVLTDRDIVIRAVSQGLNTAKAQVDDFMTARVYACNEDDLLEDAAERMRAHKVSRLLVRTHDGKVTGVLSFGHILRQSADAGDVTNAVKHALTKAIA